MCRSSCRCDSRILDVLPRLPLRLRPAHPCCQRRRLILDYFVYSAMTIVSCDGTTAIPHYNPRGGLLCWSLQTLTLGWGLLPSMCGTANTGTCFHLRRVSRSGKPGARFVHDDLTTSSSTSTSSFRTLYDCVAVFVYGASFCATVTLARRGPSRVLCLRPRLVPLIFFGVLDSYIDHNYPTHGNSTIVGHPCTRLSRHNRYKELSSAWATRLSRQMFRSLEYLVKMGKGLNNNSFSNIL
jgi:hypothetical protein